MVDCPFCGRLAETKETKHIHGRALERKHNKDVTCLPQAFMVGAPTGLSSGSRMFTLSYDNVSVPCPNSMNHVSQLEVMFITISSPINLMPQTPFFLVADGKDTCLDFVADLEASNLWRII